MDNMFLDLLYQREFYCKNIFDRIKFWFRYKSFIRSLKKDSASFKTMWDFAHFLRWIDIIYGIDEEINKDIDLLKKRNPYNENEITFSILPDYRTIISFTLSSEDKMITIVVSRVKIRNSDNKESKISFYADQDSYSFSHHDMLMISDINRLLEDKMIRYTKMYYERIK